VIRRERRSIAPIAMDASEQGNLAREHSRICLRESAAAHTIRAVAPPCGEDA